MSKADEQRVFDAFLAKLELRRSAEETFSGQPETSEGRVYGGFVAAQAVLAAASTVETGEIHSLHAYFVRLGRPDHAIEYSVERVRDGKSFSTRAVTARQDGATIFHMLASFTVAEEGFGYQDPMPDVPPPGDDVGRQFPMGSPTLPTDLHRYEERRPIVVRMCAEETMTDPGETPPPSHVWMRPKGALPEDSRLHAALLTYATDESAAISSARPRRMVNERWFGASLDHSVWFHRPPRFDGWLLFSAQGAGAHGNRPLAFGKIFTQSGIHVASVMQEALHRPERAVPQG